MKRSQVIVIVAAFALLMSGLLVVQIRTTRNALENAYEFPLSTFVAQADEIPLGSTREEIKARVTLFSEIEEGEEYPAFALEPTRDTIPFYGPLNRYYLNVRFDEHGAATSVWAEDG